MKKKENFEIISHREKPSLVNLDHSMYENLNIHGR